MQAELCIWRTFHPERLASVMPRILPPRFGALRQTPPRPSIFLRCICHAHFLENVAALSRDSAYLGAWSLAHDSDEFRFYRDACEFTFARLPQQPSIVNTSIIAAVNGNFGDVHPTERTEGSSLFINPLMGLYWSFHLDSVARRNLYLDQIRNTDTVGEVSLAIERFRESLSHTRPWTTIPC